MSRNTASKGADDQVKLKKILDELTKREENKFCADCGCRGTLKNIPQEPTLINVFRRSTLGIY